MILKVVFMLSFSLVTSLVATPFQGNGKIYITHSNAVNKTGVRFIYRPEHLEDYSEENGLRAFVRFYSGVTKADTLKNYIQNLDAGVLMNWENEGRYYWYDHNQGRSVFANRKFGYTVTIYSQDRSMVYIDKEKLYTIPPNVKFCYLDSEVQDYAFKCSYALDGYTDVPKHLTPRDDKNPIKINEAAVAALVVCTCLLILIIAVVCIKRHPENCPTCNRA